MIHAYVLLDKPAVLTMQEWQTVIEALVGVLDKRGPSSMPAKRLHSAVSLDQTKILLEGMFDLADLDPEDVGRLCRYVSEALEGKYSPEQVRQGILGHVTVYGGATWRERGDAARAAKGAAREEWEEDEPG